MANKSFIQFLSTGGDGTGTTSIVADYSGASAETFEIANQSTVATTVVRRIVAHVQDAGAFSAVGFGNAAARANGVSLQVRSVADDVLMDLFPILLTANGHWARYAFDADVKTWGVGNEMLVARLSFSKFADVADQGLVLTDGERLVLGVNDSYTDMVDFTVVAQGFTTTDY